MKYLRRKTEKVQTEPHVTLALPGLSGRFLTRWRGARMAHGALTFVAATAQVPLISAKPR